MLSKPIGFVSIQPQTTNRKERNLYHEKLLIVFAVGCVLPVVSAKDIYVSISSGKNKNSGTKESPLKNLWKAFSVASVGDEIHVAEGIYPGKMKQN